MKTYLKISAKAIAVLLLVSLLNTVFAATSLYPKKDKVVDNTTFITINGKIVDHETQVPLVFASISIEGTNIATVSNTKGFFTIKIPNEYASGNLNIMYMGYENLSLPITNLKTTKSNTFKMTMVSVKLTEVSIFPNNPRLIIKKVLENRRENYHNEPYLMTAFYRETIKRRRSYVGLSEAVVKVYKQPFYSVRNDAVKLVKGRKSSDVEKMDTLLFKLQGGPNSTLSLDIIKNPYIILSEDIIDSYDFSYLNITRVNGELNYVIEFKQSPNITTPLFYGKFYINVDNFAISSLIFSLNTENRSEASALFIKKKPFGVSVYPTSADYLVNYTEKDGKWYYSYSRGEVTFKVNWKRKLFNTTYTTMVEMAVTNWKNAEGKTFKASDRIKMNVIMSDAVNGFTDKDFWGELNIIEPEKSIESAIKKIKKKLE